MALTLPPTSPAHRVVAAMREAGSWISGVPRPVRGAGAFGNPTAAMCEDGPPAEGVESVLADTEQHRLRGLPDASFVPGTPLR